MNRLACQLLTRSALFFVFASFLSYLLLQFAFFLPTPDYSHIPLVEVRSVHTDTYYRCGDCAPVLRGDLFTCHACFNLTHRTNLTEAMPPEAITRAQHDICLRAAHAYLAQSGLAHFVQCDEYGSLCHDAASWFVALLIRGREPIPMGSVSPTQLVSFLALVLGFVSIGMGAARLVKSVRDDVRADEKQRAVTDQTTLARLDPHHVQ